MSARRPSTSEVYPPLPEDAPFNPRVPGIDYGVLDGLLGYAVRRAQIVQYESFIASLARWNITPPRFSAMVVISRNPNLKLTELANVLGIARSGAVALINSLEAMNYVRRVPCPTDKRALGLELTDQGRTDLEVITAAVVEQDQRASGALSATEQAQLIALLGRISGGIGNR